jgi:hypothetical protein
MSLVIDICVAVLLISAIGYGMILNRKIVALRGDQANLERLAASFHEATKRAETSVGELKKAAQNSSEILSGGIDEATRIREDLNFLVDRGEKLGDRLESSIRSVESTGSWGDKAKQSKTLLNPVDPRESFVSSKISKKVSSEPENNVTSFDAELLGNKIVKSEVEREFIQALKAVR